MSQADALTQVRQATAEDVDIILHQRLCMFADMGRGDEGTRAAMVAAARPLIGAGLKSGSYRGWLVEVGGRVVAGGGNGAQQGRMGHARHIINLSVECQLIG